MKIATTYLGIGLAALLVAVVPVVASYQIAKQDSFSFQTGQLEAVASDLARRANETGLQLAKARDEINSGEFGPPESASEIQHLRSLALTSTYLQAVGRTRGTKILCTSMGKLNPPVDLGPPDIITVHSVHIWLNITLGFTGEATYHALESEGCIVFIAPNLILDTFSDQPNLSMAVVTGASNKVLSIKGTIESKWRQMLGSAQKATWVDDQNIIAMERCKDVDIIAVVSQPLRHAYSRITIAAMISLPIGAAIGVMMAIYVFRAGRKQHTLPYVLKMAVKNSEFFMNYQPVTDLASG